MGSMQIRAGIWFFSMDLKGEVRGSRGGTAIIMTHTKATFISTRFTSLALRVWREIREHCGVEELSKGRNWDKDWERSGRKMRRRRAQTQDGAKGGGSGRCHSVLAISHSATAPRLYGEFPVMVLLFN